MKLELTDRQLSVLYTALNQYMNLQGRDVDTDDLRILSDIVHDLRLLSPVPAR